MEGERYISFAENNTRLNSNLDMILFNQFLKQDLVGDQPHLESGCPIFENPRLKKKKIYTLIELAQFYKGPPEKLFFACRTD